MFEIHGDDQPIVIALNVEDHPIISHYACLAMYFLQLVKILKILLRKLMIPCQ